MNSISARLNDLVELLDSNLTTIVLFLCTAGAKAALVDSENKRTQELLIACIEWDV
ncbi:MAG: hypothetical protein ACT4P6_13290 [Gemmatimonadaceae bacterium]